MNNKLQIMGLWPNDIDDLSTYRPSDPRDVYFHLYIDIGDQSGNVSEFQVEIGTPKGMMSCASEHDLTLITDRNLIVMSEYSFDLLEESINNILLKCESNDWDASVLKLQRYFLWEYEDFKRA